MHVVEVSLSILSYIIEKVNEDQKKNQSRHLPVTTRNYLTIHMKVLNQRRVKFLYYFPMVLKNPFRCQHGIRSCM
jgi:hypothetical protein